MPANLPLPARIPAAIGRLLDWAAPRWAAWCWGRAVAAGPRSPELHFARAQALARSTRWREAARSYAMAAHLSPANVEYQGSLVLALERTAATEAALEALRRFADLRPGDGEVHVLIGTLQRRCGRSAEALRSFRLAVALGHPPRTRRFLLGEMLLGAKQWEESLAALGLARGTGEAAPIEVAPPRRDRSPLNFQPLRSSAPGPVRIRSAPRRFVLWPRRLARDFAVALVARLRRLQPRACGVAQAFVREQRLRAIRRAARRMRSTAARGVAVNLLLLGVLPCAAAAGAEPPVVAPTTAPARPETAAGREQARLCERLSGEEGARACRSALSLGIAPARRAPLRQRLALHLVALESWDELAELYGEAVRDDPADAQAWRRLGMVQLYALAAPVEAIGALREAARLAAGDAETHLALGVALASLGRSTEATSELERAVQLDASLLDNRPAARAILDASRQGRSWP